MPVLFARNALKQGYQCVRAMSYAMLAIYNHSSSTNSGKLEGIKAWKDNYFFLKAKPKW